MSYGSSAAPATIGSVETVERIVGRGVSNVVGQRQSGDTFCVTTNLSKTHSPLGWLPRRLWLGAIVAYASEWQWSRRVSELPAFAASAALGATSSSN